MANPCRDSQRDAGRGRLRYVVPVLLEELIRKLPSDTAEKVKKAKERFNTRIRESLRRETRLSLHRQTDTRNGRDEINHRAH